MPHTRERFSLEPVLKSLAWSPAVGVYGLRQVGKSTLVGSVLEEKRGDYESFDRDTTLSQSRNRPFEFCDRDRLLCIDECQKAPWIFPVIKDLIGTQRRPGRFLLTGSIRFTLKNEIQEALTGRIVLFELLPFTLAEATHQSPSVFLQTCFECFFKGAVTRKRLDTDALDDLKKTVATRKVSLKQVFRHLSVGGMPVPCFSRDESSRKTWCEGFFETLITRDLVLVEPRLAGILPAQGLGFLKKLALMQGQELNYADLSEASALSLARSKYLLGALVALCLIDLIVPEVHAEKSRRKMRVEWKDSGLWNYFSQSVDTGFQDNLAAMGLFLSQELRFQLGKTKNMTQWTYYKSHNGAHIPWIFRQGERAIAMTYLPSENPAPYHYRALKQFVTRTPQSVGIILGAARAPFLVLDHRILLMSFTAVL